MADYKVTILDEVVRVEALNDKAVKRFHDVVDSKSPSNQKWLGEKVVWYIVANRLQAKTLGEDIAKALAEEETVVLEDKPLDIVKDNFAIVEYRAKGLHVILVRMQGEIAIHTLVLHAPKVIETIRAMELPIRVEYHPSDDEGFVLHDRGKANQWVSMGTTNKPVTDTQVVKDSRQTYNTLRKLFYAITNELVKKDELPNGWEQGSTDVRSITI